MSICISSMVDIGFSKPTFFQDSMGSSKFSCPNPCFFVVMIRSNGETSTSTRFFFVGDSGEDEAGSRNLEKVHAGAQDGQMNMNILPFDGFFLRFL